MQVDFEYLSDIGEVVLEVTYEYNPPDPFAFDSDFDYIGWLFIDSCKVFKDGKEIDYEVPESHVLSLLEEYFRERDIDDCFYAEQGF